MLNFARKRGKVVHLNQWMYLRGYYRYSMEKLLGKTVYIVREEIMNDKECYIVWYMFKTYTILKEDICLL